MQLVSVSCPSESSAGSVMISLVTTGLLNTEDYFPSGFNHAEGSLSGWNKEVVVLVVLFLLTSPILSFGGSFTVCSMRFSSAFFTWLIVVQCFSLLFHSLQVLFLPSKWTLQSLAAKHSTVTWTGKCFLHKADSQEPLCKCPQDTEWGWGSCMEPAV